ncbi:sensor histidine kinase [Mucilaginibacter oryzae]|nr:histidine kinase [Mucilaginibacter oryzae]
MNHGENYTKHSYIQRMKPAHFNLRVITQHAAWWLFFIIYELSIYFLTDGHITHLLRTAIYYLCNISLFYSQKVLLDHYLGSSRKYYRLILPIAIELIVYMLAKLTADYLLTDFEKSSEPKIQVLKGMAALDFYRCIFFTALASLYWTALNISRYQRQTAEAKIKQLTAERDNLYLETDLAKARNAYLQQQMNPHLLFNSLNFIHNDVYRYSEAAAENVLLLADIMRYTVEGAEPDGKISLVKEAEQLNNLIHINRSRFDYPLNLDYTVSGDISACRIIPLVLMTLLENIFKHADLRGRPAFARLMVSDRQKLTFETGNYKSSVSPNARVQSLGLKNICLRLDYAYGNNYRLDIKDGDDYYQSTLTIQL